jgi:copper chaperone CopZ
VIKQAFQIRDMHCAMCSVTINSVLEDLAGVEEASTSYARSRTEVTYDPAQVSVDAILAALRGAGYEAVALD